MSSLSSVVVMRRAGQFLAPFNAIDGTRRAYAASTFRDAYLFGVWAAAALYSKDSHMLWAKTWKECRKSPEALEAFKLASQRQEQAQRNPKAYQTV